MKIHLRSFLTGVLLVLVLANVVFFIKKHRPAKVVPPAVESTVPQAPLKVRGPASAPVKLVEYSDFECPSCRVVQENLQGLFKEYPGKIQLTFKHFPLTSHKWAIYAHQAAECMNRQGKFWEFQDRVYARQLEWAPALTAPVETLGRYATELGADMKEFGKCMSDVEVTGTIYAEKAEGNKRHVGATPTVFLGEERFVGPKEMRERGENAIRAVLGLPAKPLPPEPIPEPSKPAAPAPAAESNTTK